MKKVAVDIRRKIMFTMQKRSWYLLAGTKLNQIRKIMLMIMSETFIISYDYLLENMRQNSLCGFPVFKD